MKKTIDFLSIIRNRQDTIDKLLDKGLVVTHLDDIESLGISEGLGSSKGKKWVIDTLYQKPDCTIGFAYCENMEGLFPDHIHAGIKEYLICVKGSFLETFGKNGIDGSRVMREGDCCAIDADLIHSSRPLEPNTRMVFVCVPQDATIPDVMKGYEP